MDVVVFLLLINLSFSIVKGILKSHLSVRSSSFQNLAIGFYLEVKVFNLTVFSGSKAVL